MDERVKPTIAILKYLLAITALALSSFAEDKVPGIVRDRPIPDLIRDMAGTWQVQQKMWPGADKDPVTVPSAVAHRRLLVGLFSEEVMENVPQAEGDSVRRFAWLHTK